MPVPFEELEGSPKLEVNEEGMTAWRSFRVAWADWQAFCGELIGSYQVVGGAFVFTAPLEFPGFPNLVVSDIQLEAFDPASPDGTPVATLVATPNAYTAGGARVTATYTTAFDVNNTPRPDLPKVPNGTYLTFRADLGAEYVATPGRIWRWQAPANPVVPDDVNPGLLIPQGTLHLTWHRVALPPWNTIRVLRGKVNAAAFIGAPPGTVLFLGARVRRRFQFIAVGGFWEVQYTFQENTKELTTAAKVGWNYFYKETKVSSEHWVPIADEDGNSPYRAGDLSQLFVFG